MARTRAASQRTRAELAGVANLFWVASRTNAVEILYELAEGERISGDLAKATRTTVSNAATLLTKLHLIGLIARRRDGMHGIYSLTDAGRSVVAVAERATRRE
jgi:DNA-binding MarR family transcriptional regulator